MNPWENATRPGLLVDLDALFDTRLATLDSLDPLLAAFALKNGYLEREDDNFKYCPLELFQQVYRVRDNETLGRSYMTKVKTIVLDFMKDAVAQLKSDTTRNYVNIYINVHPYKIAQDAAGELLKPFHEAVNGRANVHLVNVAPDELTPEICKKHFSYIIKYDFMEWILLLGKSGAIQKNPMPEVTLIAPRLYQSGKPEDVDMEGEIRGKLEPHQCAEFFFAQFIKVEFYIPQLFSASLDKGFIDSYLAEIARSQKASKDQPAG